MASTWRELSEWPLITLGWVRTLIPPCGGSNPPAPADCFSELAERLSSNAAFAGVLREAPCSAPRKTTFGLLSIRITHAVCSLEQS